MVPAISPPPAFSPRALLTEWRPDPAVVALCVAAGLLYWAGLRRARRAGAPFPSSRTAAFFVGVVVLFVALASPIDTYADVMFSVHMGQHLLLMFVAPPLLALGAPITVALRAASPGTNRRVLARLLHGKVVSLLSYPVVAWSLFVGAQFTAHFTPLYEAALENAAIHVLEHGLMLGAGLVFWWPIVGLDPSPRPMGFPARLLALALAMPAGAFLGVAIFSADAPLYAHYASLPAPWGPSALSDQQYAGALMWVFGNLLLLVAALAVAAAWKRADDARQRRIEERLEPAG